jgi:adenylylsulfate kinase
MKGGKSIMVDQKAVEIHWHYGAVQRSDREHLKGHRGFTIWFTGLSAAGKSTLAVATEKALCERGCHTYILDGDNIRHGLNKNLGFSPEDRRENIRRIGEIAKLFTDCEIINLTAFISPYQKDSDTARDRNKIGDFIEVFFDCPIEICEQRDPNNSYKKARAGIIKEFTGMSAPYETPVNPKIHLHTEKMQVDECVQVIINYLVEHNQIS